MLSMLRRRLTYANVIASIALFIALGGTGYAAIKIPKNSVGAKQLKKNAVTAAKVKNGSLTLGDLKKGQVLSPGSAGSRFLEEAQASQFLPASAASNFLPRTGKAADADKLDGVDGASFARGQRIAASRSGNALPTGNQNTLDLPGYGQLVFNCQGTGYTLGFFNDTGDPIGLTWTSDGKRTDSIGGGTITDQAPVGPNSTIAGPGLQPTILTATADGNAQQTQREFVTLQLGNDGRASTLTITLTHDQLTPAGGQRANCFSTTSGLLG